MIVDSSCKVISGKGLNTAGAGTPKHMAGGRSNISTVHLVEGKLLMETAT